MARYNWDQLKLEYLSGDIASVSEFGRLKGIPNDTINKAAKGWREEYVNFRANIVEAAKKKLIEKGVSASVRRAHAGRTILVRSLREFGKRKLDTAKPKELADMVKIGAELENEVEQGSNPINVQINNAIKLEPIETGALIALAKAIAGTKGTA